MQAAIAVVLLVGLWTRNVSVVVNATLSLAVTFLPAALARDRGVRLGVGVTLWLTAAVLLHTVGMLGLYDDVPWWDHVTHTLSATVVAGVGYAAVKAVDDYTDAIHFPPEFLFLFVLLFTLALGVLWEVLEFAARLFSDAVGVETVLVQYGLDDTVVDLVFDAVGATLVALFGARGLARLADAVRTARARRDRAAADGDRPG